MVADIQEGVAQVMERRENLEADPHVILHMGVFRLREGARLVEDRFANADLADVVQASGGVNRLDGDGVQPEVPGDRGGDFRHPLRVPPQVQVLRFHGVDQRLGDTDTHRAQRALLALQLNRAQRHFLAHEAIDRPPLHMADAAHHRALDGRLEIGKLDGLREVVERAAGEGLGGAGGVNGQRTAEVGGARDDQFAVVRHAADGGAEGAGVGATLALILAIMRGMTMAEMKAAILSVGRTSAPLLLLLVAAQLYSRVLAMTGVTGATKEFFLSSGLSPYMILGLMVLVWFILGCIIDSISIILLTVPVFAPLAMALGFDPLAFAIIGILAIETGLLTPPFGILVFTVKAAVTDEKDLTPGEIFSGSIPFWIVLLTTILLIVIFPEIANWLPNLGNELGR